MARVVVAGSSECLRFGHVDHFAAYLANKLPDFQYHRIIINKYEWPTYVAELNKKNEWNVTQSPVVWKEPGVSGGKKYLVGGASDFWEFVQQYYGVLSNATKEGGELLAQDAYQKYLDDERETELRRKRQRYRRVTVSGATHSMTSLLVRELLNVRSLQMELGVIVTLYDRNGDVNDLREIAMDMRGVGASAGLSAVCAVETAAEALTACDVLIVLDGCKKEEGENLDSWLSRNHELMVAVASDADQHAPETCRVVYAAPDVPACVNATVIADTVENIQKTSVVAVTADLGLEALKSITEASEVPLGDVYCPPVWGSVGINKVVDLRAARYRSILEIPNRRSLRMVPGTTLPTCTSKKVVLPIGHLLGTAVGLWLTVGKHKEGSINEMYFAKVKATCDLLGYWFREHIPTLKGWRNKLAYRVNNVTSDNYMDPKAASLPKNEVISLGILSNGVNEIPEGLNFSQPAWLRDGQWVPYKRFPIPQDRYVKLKELWALPCALLKELNVGGTLNADYLLSAEELADKKLAKTMEENMRKNKMLEEEKKLRMEAEAREQALSARIRHKRQQIDRESHVMIRDHVIIETMREIINSVLDICEPYPEKIPEVAKETSKKDETGGEGGEEQQPEEEKEGDEEDEEDDEDDDEDDD